MILVKEFDMPVTVNECRRKLRQRFISTGHVTDVRAIDIMVIKVGCIVCFRDQWLSFTGNYFSVQFFIFIEVVCSGTPYGGENQNACRKLPTLGKQIDKLTLKTNGIQT